MKERISCLIIAPDGSERHAILPLRSVISDGANAPDWLIHRLGLRSGAGFNWRLRRVRPAAEWPQGLSQENSRDCRHARLCLVRTVTAGAPFDPRQARLKKERQELEKLNTESDHVRVEFLEVLEGSEPEKYRVSFYCKGITGIEPSRQPRYGEKHQVIIECDDEFPSEAPRLRWETPIWHPNIQHDEPKGVCVNKKEWLGGMGLSDLVRLMFEMVQYKNYHAEMTPPYPLDTTVAAWVRDYAEPNGIVDKKRGVSIDNKPFTRPTVTERISLVSPESRPKPRINILTSVSEPAAPRIKLGNSGSAADVPPTGGIRIKINRDK